MVVGDGPVVVVGAGPVVTVVLPPPLPPPLPFPPPLPPQSLGLDTHSAPSLRAVSTLPESTMIPATSSSPRMASMIA